MSDAAAVNAALVAHVSKYRIGPVSLDGGDGIAILEKGHDPAKLTLLGFDADGGAMGYRILVAGSKVSASLQDTVTKALASGTVQPNFLFSDVLDYFGFRNNGDGFTDSFVASFQIANANMGIPDQALANTAAALLTSGGVTEFRSKLNSEALEALSCVTNFKTAAYSFYALGGRKGEIRRQAAGAYPLLAGEISAKVLVKMAVDSMSSPVDALMKAFGSDAYGNARLTSEILKKLANKKYSDGGVPVSVIVEALAAVPASWFPKSEDEWNAFVDLTDTFFRRISPDLNGNIADMVAGAAGRWREFADRVAKKYAITWPPEDLDDEAKAQWKPVVDASRPAMESAANNTRDVLIAFRNLVVLPAAANATGMNDIFVGPEQIRVATDVAAELLLGGRSLPTIAEMQRHWHTQAYNILQAAQAEQEAARGKLKEVAEDGWAPLCDVLVAPNGVTLYPLTDPRELKDEGAGWPNGPQPDRNGVMGLGHCVGGYSSSCKSGRSHIISFRKYNDDGSFVRLSTAEFGQIRPDSNGLNKLQHYGPRNGSAPAEAVAAIKWFMEAVENLQVPINRDGVLSYLAGKRISAEEVEAYSDYDWRERNAVEDAFMPWKLYLPKKMKDLDLEAFQNCPEMSRLVESMAPSYRSGLRHA